MHRPLARILLFSEELQIPTLIGAGAAKVQKTDKAPTPTQRIAAAKKEIKRLEAEIKDVTQQGQVLQAGSFGLSDSEAMASNQAEVKRLLELLQQLQQLKIEADAELQAAVAAKREKALANAEKALDMQEEAYEKFFEEFPGSNLEDFYVYQAEREAIKSDEATWAKLGHTKETWRLWKGNRFDAEDLIRKKQEGREEAFDEWEE